MYGSGWKAKGHSKKLLIPAIITVAVVSMLFVSKVAGDDGISEGEEVLPPFLGKSLSVQIQVIVQEHREALLGIRLERKMNLLQTWEDRLSELAIEQELIMETMGAIEREMGSLKEKLNEGSITQGEFIMEMNRLRLEIRIRLKQMEGVEKEVLKALQENITGINKEQNITNKELARKIVEENHVFRDAMKTLQEVKKAEIKAMVEEEKQAKGKAKK